VSVVVIVRLEESRSLVRVRLTLAGPAPQRFDEIYRSFGPRAMGLPGFVARPSPCGAKSDSRPELPGPSR